MTLLVPMRNGALGFIVSVAAVSSLLLVSRSKKRTKENAALEKDGRDNVNSGAKLSSIQKWLVQSQDAGSDHVVCSVLMNGKIPAPEKLRHAVSVVQSLDETLASAVAYVDSQDDELRLVRTEKTEQLSGALTVVENEDWQDVSHQYLNAIQFPKPTKEHALTPTWRLVFVPKSNALLFVLNHAAFDGTTRNRFVHAFFKALSTSQKESSRAAPSFDGAEIEKKIPHKTWLGFVKDSICMVWREVTTRKTGWDPPLSGSTAKQPETRQIVFQLNKSQTSMLIRQSKNEKTTVHGALSAAATLALVQVGRKELNYESSGPTTVKSSHLISLWPQLVGSIVSERITGVLISLKSVVISIDRCNNVDAWNVARQIKEELRGFNRPWLLSQYICNMMLRKLLRLILPNSSPPEYAALQRSPAVSLSNNGAVSYDDDYGGTTIEAVYACSARHVGPGDLGMWNIQTVHGKMCLTFGFYSHLWNDSTGETYVSCLAKILHDMCTPRL